MANPLIFKINGERVTLDPAKFDTGEIAVIAGHLEQCEGCGADDLYQPTASEFMARLALECECGTEYFAESTRW